MAIYGIHVLLTKNEEIQEEDSHTEMNGSKCIPSLLHVDALTLLII